MILLSFGAWLAACGSEAATAPPGGVPVITQPVTRGATEVRLELPGEVQSPGEARLASEVAGTVVAVPARVGSRVGKGAVLVELDRRSFDIAVRTAAGRLEQARAQVAVRQAALDRVRVNSDRLLSVRQKDPTAVSQLEADEAALAVREAEAALQAAQADVGVRQAEVDGAALEFARSRIVSPIEGVVSRQDGRIGQRVGPGSYLVTVLGAGGLEAVLDLGEAQAGTVVPGAAVRLKLPGHPGLVVDGTVSGVVPAAEGVSRNQRLRVDIASPPPELLPGLAVRAEVAVATLTDAIQVPRDAVVKGAVFVVEGEKARRVPVEVRYDLGETLVVTGALEPGAPLVVRGNEALADGVAVRSAAGAPEP